MLSICFDINLIRIFETLIEKDVYNTFDLLEEASLIYSRNIQYDIEGHSDESESSMYSFDVSEKRANAVRTFLISKGIDGGRLSISAVGSINPDAGGGTTQAKAQNRRVQFIATE